jgi:hypothetical protein
MELFVFFQITSTPLDNENMFSDLRGFTTGTTAPIAINRIRGKSDILLLCFPNHNNGKNRIWTPYYSAQQNIRDAVSNFLSAKAPVPDRVPLDSPSSERRPSAYYSLYIK